jgi:hypothetical protein
VTSSRARTRAVPVLAVLLGALVVAAIALGVVDARATARDEDGAAALPAVRTHLTALVAAPSSPTARAQALDGATGAWRARLESGAAPAGSASGAAPAGSVSGAAPAGSAIVVRAVGLESLDGDSARVLTAARLSDGTAQRAWRVAATLTRVDDRWLVSDLAEVP